MGEAIPIEQVRWHNFIDHWFPTATWFFNYMVNDSLICAASSCNMYSLNSYCFPNFYLLITPTHMKGSEWLNIFLSELEFLYTRAKAIV